MIDTAQFVVHCGHIILYAVVNLVCLGLNRYIEVLDKRLDQQEKELSGAAARKPRKLGLPSLLHPPANAPVWAVKRNYSHDHDSSQGKLFCIV